VKLAELILQNMGVLLGSPPLAFSLFLSASWLLLLLLVWFHVMEDGCG
jgi:hypothetical protein